MENATNTGGVSFSSSDSSGSLEGLYTKTDTGYYHSGGLRLFIGSSCSPYASRGLWSKTDSGKTKYISSLKPHQDKTDTYVFDILKEKGNKEYFLLILKEDRLRIVSPGGNNAQ